eukprot:6919037-Lingulodinium_polyedra.AAC.1
MARNHACKAVESRLRACSSSCEPTTTVWTLSPPPPSGRPRLLGNALRKGKTRRGRGHLLQTPWLGK